MNENKTVLIDEQGAATVATAQPNTPTKSKVITTPILQKRLGSKFARVIPSFAYNPPPKPPSRVDKHRESVRLAKQNVR